MHPITVFTFSVITNSLWELWREFWAHAENLEFSKMPFLEFHCTLPCKNLMVELTPAYSSFFYIVRNQYTYQHVKSSQADCPPRTPYLFIFGRIHFFYSEPPAAQVDIYIGDFYGSNLNHKIRFIIILLAINYWHSCTGRATWYSTNVKSQFWTVFGI